MKDIQSVCVTGGTGSFGQRFIRHLLRNNPELERIVIFSRDEYKQSEMMRFLSPRRFPALKYILGDIRNIDSLRRALEGIEVVIHAAALKQVQLSENNGLEFIKTNVLGSHNLLKAARESGAKKVVILSSDKAVRPLSMYGATKLSAEKLFLEAAREAQSHSPFYTIVRYGNVFGSRASIVPILLEQAPRGRFTLTHPDMTRFSMAWGEETKLVQYALEHTQGGDIFIPKIPAYRLSDLARAIDEKSTWDIQGLRPGEKMHEELLIPEESALTYELADYYVYYPLGNTPAPHLKARKVDTNFHYDSEKKAERLTPGNLKQLIDEFRRKNAELSQEFT